MATEVICFVASGRAGSWTRQSAKITDASNEEAAVTVPATVLQAAAAERVRTQYRNGICYHAGERWVGERVSVMGRLLAVIYG